jgi:hypothetical protein
VFVFGSREPPLPFDAGIETFRTCCGQNRALLLADIDCLNGLEQQEAIIIERIEEVNNNWSIKNEENHDNGNNNGNSKEMPLRSVRLAIAIVGKRKPSKGAPLLSIFSEFD